MVTRSEGTLLAGLVAAGAVIAVVASAADSGSNPGRAGEPAAEASASEGADDGRVPRHRPCRRDGTPRGRQASARYPGQPESAR